jgi:hypothetical protein
VQEATNSHISERKEDQMAPNLNFEFEYWVEMTENRDWEQLEKDLKKALPGVNSELNFTPTAFLRNSIRHNLPQ